MQKKLILGFSILAAIFAGLILVEKFTRVSSQEGIVHTDQKTLPDSKLINLSTKDEVSISSFKGKVLLINFWASWCEACMEEMPSIVELRNKLAPEGFEVVSINVDDEPEKIVPKIVEKFKIPFPVYRDQGEKLAETFNVVAIPYNIIIDKHLNISWMESGERNWASQEIIERIRSLLKQSS